MINAKRAQAAANDQLVADLVAEAGPAGLAAPDLATRTVLPQSTTRRVIRRLVSRGLIQREGMRGRLFAFSQESPGPEPEETPQSDRQRDVVASRAEPSSRGVGLDRRAALVTWKRESASLSVLVRSKESDSELLRRLEGLGYVHRQHPVRGLDWWQLNPEAWPWPAQVAADVVAEEGARSVAQLAWNAAGAAVVAPSARIEKRSPLSSPCPRAPRGP
jgi:hypothetical protein